MKIFEIEVRGIVYRAISRLARGYNMRDPELYLVVSDEKDRERAEKLVEPVVKSAFSRIKYELVVLSIQDILDMYECLGKKERVELVK